MAQRVKNKPELKIVVSNTPEAPAVEPVPEQVEMPFAIVNGEPVTQMPKDLYIPPQAMEVFLEAFEGPLDLLLYLIRRQNLNILDIPLAEITRQYMQYIEVMTELQLELAGEYMVMAATLAEIKSRMLLPRPKVDPDGKEEDPRAELVRRLQEYERFKRAAEGIDTLPRLERDVWMTSAELKDRSVVKLLPTVTLQEMLLAFKDVVIRSEMFAHHHISRERLSVRERMSDVLSRLEQASFVEFVRLFRLEEGRMGVTVTFMALLELVREGLIEIVQAVPFAPLHVRAAGAGRKLHVVGGNEALADGTAALADGTLVDGTAAVVVGEAVVGDVPAVGLLLPGDAGLDSIVEQVLDPNFVDDDFDEDDEPLEGVDDVVDRVAAPAEPGVPAEPAGPVEAAGSAEAAAFAEASSEVAPAVDSASSSVAYVSPVSTDAVAAVVDSLLVAAPAEFSTPPSDTAQGTIAAEQTSTYEVATQQTSAYEIAATEFAASPSEIGDAVVASATGLDEAGAVAEPVSGFAQVTDPFEPAIVSFEPAPISPEPAPVIANAVLYASVTSDQAPSADQALSSVAALEQPPATDALAAAVTSILADVPAAAVEYSSPLDQDSRSSSVTGDMGASEFIESASALHSTSGFDQVAVTIEPVSTSNASAIGDVDDSPLRREPTASADPTAALNETSAVVELVPTGDLSPLADLVTTNMSASAGVVTAGEVSSSSSDSPTSDFSAPLVDLAAPSVPLTVDFVAPAEVALPDPTTAPVAAPLSDVVTTDLSESVSVVPSDQAASPDLTAVHVSAPLSDLVTTDVADPVDFVAPVDVASPDSTADHVAAPVSDFVGADVSEPLDVIATENVASPDSAVISASAPNDLVAEDSLTAERVVSESGSSSVVGDLVSPGVPGSSDDLPTANVSTPVGDLPATDVSIPIGGFSADAPSPSSDDPALTAASSGGDIAVTFDPSMTTPAAVADEPFLTNVSAAASEPTDVEYESPEEAVAAGEQPVADVDVSLIGDTPVAGEASLIGDGSVSGGPAVEVEEFAFDELPALDDAGPADQQSAAGAEAVVNKVPGTDEPPSPGEESDD